MCRLMAGVGTACEPLLTFPYDWLAHRFALSEILASIDVAVALCVSAGRRVTAIAEPAY